ncbi:MAG: hypothetical protein ACKVOE_03435 [Rickettsiales bacterium]
MLAPQQKTTPDDDQAAVRPKVMRRPAQFSQPTPPVVAETQLAALPVVSEPSLARLPRTYPWQDDGRFGLALVAILVVVNLALLLWLPHLLPQPIATATRNPLVMLGQAAAPTPAPLPVTLYAQPSRARLYTAPVHVLGESPALDLPVAGAQ